MSDEDTLARLRNLTNQLAERLADAEAVRARLGKARREANYWPDIRSRSWQGDNLRALPYFRPSDDNDPTH